MSAPLSRGASRDLRLTLRALRQTRTHAAMLATSPTLNAEQKTEVQAARDTLRAVESDLVALEMKGGRS